MRESPRTSQDACEESSTPDVQAGIELSPSICYRMQPDRQMLGDASCDDCSVISRESVADGSNQMPPCLLSQQHHTRISLDGVCRIALMVTPQASDEPIDQAWEAVSTIRAIMKQQSVPMTVTMQTVFVRSADDIPAFKKLFEAYYGHRCPVSNFVVQPPCGGEALAIEAWALGGHDVDVEFSSPEIVTVSYDRLRWIYAAGVSSSPDARGAYDESAGAFERLNRGLQQAGTTFRYVPRVWLYQGGITSMETTADNESIERYRELNRARTDFFDQQHRLGQMLVREDGRTVYPASTGIGTCGDGLIISCLALQTDRDDVRLIPLENPGQTSAFDYGQEYSVKSPKFSRAMAVVIGDYVTTWVSGTASILNSETVHKGDVEKQTEQAIDNIERLISAENFARHGLADSGAQLTDLAKLHVYVRNLGDYEICRQVCQRRFGSLPSIYAHADICRSDLLVEIEGVAFSKRNP